jgi:cold shock protein
MAVNTVRLSVCFRHLYFFLYSFMASGTIKTKTDKGFGFIAVQGSDDVFFHHSACNGQYDNLQIGQTVQFDVESGPKGPKANNVVAAN